MTPGRAALLGLMRRYLVPLMDDAVTLLELHKLMYFMQEAGGDLRLEFVKGAYGPYPTNLRHVLNAIEGHFVTGFGDASEEPGKVLEPSAEAIKRADVYLHSKSKSQTLDRFTKVEQLIDGFETAYGMELLSSVDWVAKHEAAPAQSPEDAVTLIHQWNDRKRESFPAEHIYVAWDRLSDTGWLLASDCFTVFSSVSAGSCLARGACQWFNGELGNRSPSKGKNARKRRGKTPVKRKA